MRTSVRHRAGGSAPLTARQREVLGFIRDQVAAHGYPPTIREIANGVGLTSPGTAQHHVDELERKGYLFRRRDSLRTIQVLNPGLPERPVPLVALVGQVAAGQPILAIEHIEDYVPAPSGTLRGDDGCFALRVSGNSMEGAGILDGDLVVVRPQPDAEDGDIVVARFDDPTTSEAEVTVKRLRRKGSSFELVAENPDFAPIQGREMTIEGIVVQGFFDIPVDALIATKILARRVRERHGHDVLVVAPDGGGVDRARKLARILDNVIGDVEGAECVSSTTSSRPEARWPALRWRCGPMGRWPWTSSQPTAC